MASDPGFAEYVCEQISGAGEVSSRKMFGEYGIYCDQKMVGLVCDNQFFVKPTAAGRAYLGTVQEAPPFPGAKPYFLMSDELDDREQVAALVRITAAGLPLPKPKAMKKPKPSAVRKG